MEKKGISLGHIRGLLVAQEGRCAITGVPLDPSDVNGDHIIPISRSDLSPPPNKQNIWLVAKRINAMKGTMTYDELVDASRLIIAYEERSRALISKLSNEAIGEINKEDFDLWVQKHCDSDGKIIG
jgi:5-methylcytosine-specific restriction endonuclease McrA